MLAERLSWVASRVTLSCSMMAQGGVAAAAEGGEVLEVLMDGGADDDGAFDEGLVGGHVVLHQAHFGVGAGAGERVGESS